MLEVMLVAEVCVCVWKLCLSPEALQAQAVADAASEPALQFNLRISTCRCWSPRLLHEETGFSSELDSQTCQPGKHKYSL